jgi:hypothetical protein
MGHGIMALRELASLGNGFAWLTGNTIHKSEIKFFGRNYLSSLVTSDSFAGSTKRLCKIKLSIIL